MNYQWYPGHMTKAKRMMEENIKLIDLVIELVDARLPLSSRNPDIDNLAKNKSKIILLNKSDLADDKITEQWINYFKEKDISCVKLNSRNNTGIKQVNQLVMESCKAKIEKDRSKGIMNRPIRAMVVGIPNVGKSTFINSFAGKACAKTGNKPGVTKGKQWIKLNKNVELLDTPGILWPKFEDQAVGLRLALIGSMNDNILNTEELALELIKYLIEHYPQLLKERYNVEKITDGLETMEAIAGKRGCLKKGGITDYEKVSGIILDDFRSGRMGRISLEIPQ